MADLHVAVSLHILLKMQVGAFLQSPVNSFSTLLNGLPVLSPPLASGVGVYPGESWCKVRDSFASGDSKDSQFCPCSWSAGYGF
jgi:hypothetical protein